MLIERLSLVHGWLPLVIQVVTVAALVRAIGWRSRRWRLVRIPLISVFGALTAIVAHWYLGFSGIASEPAPWQLWLWTALSGIAVATVVAGWRRARWTRRNLSVFAASFCLLCSGLAVNSWLGYFSTVSAAWNQLAARPLPDQVDRATLAQMRRSTVRPVTGALVAVTISAGPSGFGHREEFVYLPPAWFAGAAPPQLPTVMMIGGEFNTPADWVRVGDAVSTLDGFAAAHGGNAPVAVFVDATGSFDNDTECVNGPRGQAADHLIKDVVPYMITNFGVSASRAHWGVTGFSSGGTCAADLTAMHPDVFGAFIDIAGDIGPNAGTRAQTVERLYGGNLAAWSAFDPRTVITRHGRYTDVSGVFVVNATDLSPRADQFNRYGQAAHSLCALGKANGINCSVVVLPGRHIWPFASTAFTITLPWLAGELNTPGAARAALPKPRQ
ncbi:MAG: alpha/beta hydrolase-fold protein [Mycobacterium sp.]